MILSTAAGAASTCDACGWLAAICSMLAFGSFGVPIKSQAALSVDIDPLVFQSYKTFMCFLTAWLVLLAGEEFTFSAWGIVSGLFWVPGGVATIYAVKSAGLAIGIGIGSSFIVLVSFVWGIFIFHERVHSRLGACFAILCMMLGLVGMSYYSSPESIKQDGAAVIRESEQEDNNENLGTSRRRNVVEYQGLGSHDNDEEDEENNTDVSGGLQSMNPKLKTTERTQQMSFSDNSNIDEKDTVLPPTDPDDESSLASGQSDPAPASETTVVFCGVKITKRHLGMLSAMFCGVWGGSIMAPMKWCDSDTKGTHYLLSFAIGSSIVTLGLWFLRYCYYVSCYKSFSVAYASLPSFHVRVMWLPGGTSGLLWSIGNFFSLISVFYLGEGVGYPLVQTSILVSGLWGIVYFKEVTGTERITKWFISSLLTIFGILLLSYEHHEK